MQSRASTAELPNNAVVSDRTASSAQIKAISLVVVCTIVGAAAQILMKMGADAIDAPALIAAVSSFDLMGIVAALPSTALIAGYACYALNTVLLVLALREGELSVLYPIIALTYVWVTLLSPMFFPDEINVFKALGVSLIVGGVALIGMGSKKGSA